MENQVEDQVQQDSPQPKVVERVEDQATEQSETTEEVAEAKEQLFNDHLGRELTAQQLHEEYLKTQSYVTQLETERKKWEDKAQQEARQAVAEDDLLKGVDPNVREAIVKIVTPVIEERIKQVDAEQQRKAEDAAFSRKLDELTEKYPGGNGLPKFERNKVLSAMRDPGNDIFDPEWKFKTMNWSEFVDFETKQAIKGKSSDVTTEDTGGSTPRKPSSKTPRTWEEASKSALSRV